MKTPKTAPLVVILIVTSLLGLAMIFPTVLLLNTITENWQKPSEWLFTAAMVSLPIIGFALLFGYFVAVFLKRHSAIFWICSSLFNFALSGLCFYSLFHLFTSFRNTHYYTSELQLSACIGLFMIWTLFVALTSLYYARFASVLGFRKLP